MENLVEFLDFNNEKFVLNERIQGKIETGSTFIMNREDTGEEVIVTVTRLYCVPKNHKLIPIINFKYGPKGNVTYSASATIDQFNSIWI